MIKAQKSVKLLLLPLMMLVVFFAQVSSPAYAQGYPAFNIDSWSTDKETLYAGDEFVLTITFSNVGTYGANEVLVEIEENANFIGVGTSPRYQHMGIGAQVTTSFQIGISGSP